MRNQPNDNQQLMRTPPAGAFAFQKFDTKIVAPFYERSTSKETRRAYRRVVKELFAFLDNKHPMDVTVSDVQYWRDHLTAQKRSAATVTFKLSVIRSMFDYLKIAGIVNFNPALTKLVLPPALAEDLRGRALTAKEVSWLLAGQDRRKTDGARDYALLLLMLRTGMRVSEVCSLKMSSVRWSHG